MSVDDVADGRDAVLVVLELLERGQFPGSGPGAEPSPVAVELWHGEVAADVLGDDEVVAALSSRLGPALAVPLAGRLDPFARWSSVDLLPAPPLQLGTFLGELHRSYADVPADRRAASLYRLEALVTSLPEPVPRRLIRSLDLPGSLGRILDAQVVTFEHGGPLPSGASATAPLLVTCDALGVRSAFDLLPAKPGDLAGDAPFPFDELAAMAQGMILVGAPAAALRTLVLVHLLAPAGTVDTAVSQALVKLVVHGEAAVPPDRVVDVWSLARR